MGLRILSRCFNSLKLKHAGIPVNITGTPHQKRNRNKYSIPKLRYPYWYLKQDRAKYEEYLTPENTEFIQNVLKDTYNSSGVSAISTPLKEEPVSKGTWYPNCRRSGVIAIKLGYIPQWLTNGQPVKVTLLQVVENHVINYIPPGKDIDLRPYARKMQKYKNLGSLIVGAVNCDPQNLTKQYCGLFNKAGVMPKKILTKFSINPEAVIQPGTPLFAAHFRVGDYVDVSGRTISRGFQGVMKRWGFHGQPASHGQTKTHRRPGNIGGGGEKGRVWPGKKMPGHVGNRTRTSRGLKILRINHKYNVLYVRGTVAGSINSFVYVHDTYLPISTSLTPPRFPTYFPENEAEGLPEEENDETLFDLSQPTITFPQTETKTKK